MKKCRWGKETGAVELLWPRVRVDNIFPLVFSLLFSSPPPAAYYTTAAPILHLHLLLTSPHLHLPSPISRLSSSPTPPPLALVALLATSRLSSIATHRLSQNSPLLYRSCSTYLLSSPLKLTCSVALALAQLGVAFTNSDVAFNSLLPSHYRCFNFLHQNTSNLRKNGWY